MTREPHRQLQIQTTEEPMETALARPDEKKLESGLAVLQQRAIAIVVRDPDSYRLCCEGKAEAQKYIKDAGFELDPGIAKAKETYDHLRNQKAKYVDPAKAIVDTFAKKAEEYRTEEKRKADAEARRLQEEARVAQERKAAEERRVEEARIAEENKKRQAEIAQARAAGELKARDAAKLQKQADADAEAARQLAEQEAAKTAAAVPVVKVEASIPKVAGSKNQTYWKFRVVDELKIPRAFLMPNEAGIGRMVRDTKDKAAAETACPGIEVWSEG
jgi:multidrug efflux pump subunit AcrA (membrane-fusion protein)